MQLKCTTYKAEADYQGVKLKLLPSNKAQRRLGFFGGETNAKLTDMTRQR